MESRSLSAKAFELGLKFVGHPFPRLSRVNAAACGNPFEGSARFDMPGIGGFGYFLLDVTRTEGGQFHLIEANGSNAALSSSVTGRDDRRARHMYLTYKSKRKPRGQITCLLSHQKELIHVAEFYERAGVFAQCIANDQIVDLRAVDEDLGEEEVTVIVGAITDIAPFVQKSGGTLLYRGRPVAFGSNPNLLAELVRLGVIGCENGIYDIDDSIFHEGRCTPVVHNKGLQQTLARGTRIAPLRWAEANDLEECIRVIECFRADGIVAVGKMNAGSGGAGIQFFTPDMSSEQCGHTLRQIIDSAQAKHGEAATRTLFPIRFFEFAQSTPYNIYGEPHLWDMRIQCLVQPGVVDVTPCVIRLCPEPFDGSYSWNTVVSNLTGRDPAGASRFMRSPFAERRSQPGTVLAALGMSRESLRDVLEGCAQWCVAAWEWGEGSRHERVPTAVHEGRAH
jgi:hypothetical protein